MAEAHHDNNADANPFAELAAFAAGIGNAVRQAHANTGRFVVTVPTKKFVINDDGVPEIDYTIVLEGSHLERLSIYQTENARTISYHVTQMSRSFADIEGEIMQLGYRLISELISPEYIVYRYIRPGV